MGYGSRGVYIDGGSRSSVPTLQILTVEEILAGKKVAYPGATQATALEATGRPASPPGTRTSLTSNC